MATIPLQLDRPDCDPGLAKDLRTLARFISIYCRHKHQGVSRRVFRLRGFDLEDLKITPPQLCVPCSKLLSHAFVKRLQCPYNPKPACKHCQTNCYQPAYRAEIRKVMRFSGRKLVLSGRLDLLFKLLF